MLELKQLRPSGIKRLQDMKERVSDLKTQRETARKQIVDESIAQFVERNNPDIRALESKRLQKYYEDERAEQLKEHEAQRERERVQKAEEIERLKAELAQLEQENKQKEKEKARKKEEIKGDLEAQMEELRIREEEAERIRWRVDALQVERDKLAVLELERRARDKEEMQRRLGAALQRQHKASMLKRAREIQLQLQQDLSLLEDLAQAEKEEQLKTGKRREQAQADVEWMKEETLRQLRLEQEREQQLDDVYKEEAARVFARQDAQWERERQARDALMQKVLAERQQQIEAQLLNIREQQKESVEKREQLLEMIEQEAQATKRDQQQKKHAVEKRQTELYEQVDVRRKKEQQRQLEEQRQLQKEAEEEQAYQKWLASKTARADNTYNTYTPPKYGRRRAAWD